MNFLAIFAVIFAILAVLFADSPGGCCNCPRPEELPSECDVVRCASCPVKEPPLECCTCPPPEELPSGCEAVLCQSCLLEEPTSTCY